MSRNRSSNRRQVPSIIDQIVIYDKPNKPSVPKEILHQSNNFELLGQGDIVLTCKDVAESTSKTKEKKVKIEPRDNEDDVNVKIEPVNSLNEVYGYLDEGDLNNASNETLEEEATPFKRPRGRPKKAPKCTVLNFLIKHSINEEIHIESSKPSENEESLPRLRRRTRKGEEQEHFRIEEVPAVSKTRKNSKFSIAATCNQTISDQLELSENEDEIQNSEEQKRAKSVKKPAKKTPGRKPKAEQQKKTEVLQKKIKQENEEVSDQLLDVTSEEACDSEDSPQEWEPEELAELKQQHVMKLIKKMHKCKFCPMEFTTYYGLRKHRVLDHDDMGKVGKFSKKVPIKALQDQDDDDSDGESSRGEWMPQDYAEYKAKHKHKYTHRYKCKICLISFASYYQLSKHKMEHENQENPYECKYCGETFNDLDVFTAHIRVHQGKDPYPCKKCNKGFGSKEELNAHMPVHVLKKGPALPKKYRCDICGKEFAKLGDVDRHTRVHTGEKPVECNICHKRFQQQHNLTKHLLIHLHVKPFQCEICNKKFGRIDVLNRHLLTHSLEKPFKCELCHKGFIRHHQLTTHNEKAHPELDFEEVESHGRTPLGNTRMTGEMTVTAISQWGN